MGIREQVFRPRYGRAPIPAGAYVSIRFGKLDPEIKILKVSLFIAPIV
jgi:hypothetical protein